LISFILYFCFYDPNLFYVTIALAPFVYSLGTLHFSW